MRTISEREMAVFISLLSGKISEMEGELRALEADGLDAGEEQDDDRYALQEMVAQYEQMLDGLRDEYEEGLVDGTNLPGFDELIRSSRSWER